MCYASAPMMAHVFFACLLWALTILNYRLGKRNVLYPAFVFSTIWATVLSIYFIPLIELDSLMPYTLVVITLGNVAFSAGGILCRPVSIRQAMPVASRPAAKRLMLAYCVCILPFFGAYIWGTGDADTGILRAARLVMLESVKLGEPPIPAVYSTAATLSVLVAFIFLIELSDWDGERWWLASSISIALAFCVLTTGRTMLLQLIVGLCGIYLLKKDRLSAKRALRSLRWPMAVLFSLLLSMAVLGKAVTEDSPIVEAFKASVFGYAVLPTAGLNYVLTHGDQYQHEPNHTFREILPVLNKIDDLPHLPSPPLDDPLFVPGFTNVFTAFKFYYVDFGFAGMFVAFFLIGACQTWLFGRAMARDHCYLFLFAMSLSPLVMIAFDDQYSMFFTYGKQILFAVCYFRILRTAPVIASLAS